MRFFISIMAAVLLAVVVLAACNSNEQTPKISSSATPATGTPQQPPADNTRRITPQS